jgi:hypothetical protein
MKTTAAILILAALMGMASAQITDGENPPFCSGMDICSWSTDLPDSTYGLPLGSPEDNAGTYCAANDLEYNTYWPKGTDANPSYATVTCTFSANSAQMMKLYYSIDNDMVSCTLNGDPIAVTADGNMSFTHEGCADSDPVGGGHYAPVSASTGTNTVVCQVRDRGYMSYFNGCVVPDNPEPLPEFSSTLVPLAILTIVPAMAYLIVVRKRE